MGSKRDLILLPVFRGSGIVVNLFFVSFSNVTEATENAISNGLRDLGLDFRIIVPGHGVHARIPHAWLQPLRRQIFPLLRLAHCCRIGRELWYCWEWPALLPGPRASGCADRKDVCDLPSQAQTV